MKRNYDPNSPSDVRLFSQEIARLTKSGPIGAHQAEEQIADLERTSDGKALVQKARHQAKIQAQALGIDFSNVQVHSDDYPYMIQQELRAEPFSSKSDVSFASAGDHTDLVAHELTHVVQQAAQRGLK